MDIKIKIKKDFALPRQIQCLFLKITGKNGEDSKQSLPCSNIHLYSRKVIYIHSSLNGKDALSLDDASLLNFFKPD